MLARLIALLVVVTVLPTVELTEQAVHVVEHFVHDEPADHSAHHADGDDEHGCTGLIHICGCHHTLVTGPTLPATVVSLETLDMIAIEGPRSLHDQLPVEPPHRPPIG